MTSYKKFIYKKKKKKKNSKGDTIIKYILTKF